MSETYAERKMRLDARPVQKKEEAKRGKYNLENPQSLMISLRCNPNQKKRWEATATKCGEERLSLWIKQTLDAEVEKTKSLFDSDQNSESQEHRSDAQFHLPLMVEVE